MIIILNIEEELEQRENLGLLYIDNEMSSYGGYNQEFN